MVLVIRKDNVIIGEPKYKPVFERAALHKTRRLSSGNDFSHGDAREEDTRELERNPQNRNQHRNSVLSKMFSYLIKNNTPKVLDKKHAKHAFALKSFE